VEITPRLPLLDEAAKLEIEGLFRVWCKLRPESIAAATLVDRGGVASDSASLVLRKAN
jgi:hypothetical protein